MRHPLGILLWLVLILISSRASAEPYELFARYTRAAGLTTGDATLEIPLSPDAPIPRAGIDYILNGIFLRVRSDDISRSALMNHDRLTFSVSCDRCKNHKTLSQLSTSEIPLKDGKPDKTEYLIISPTDIASPALGEVLGLSVQSRFSGDFLCAVEGQYRAQVKSDHPVGQIDQSLLDIVHPADTPEARRGECKQQGGAIKSTGRSPASSCKFDADGLFALTYLSRNPEVISKSERLVFSFCPRVGKQIDWSRAATGRSESPEQMRLRQRGLLTTRLRDFLKARGFENVRVAPDLGGNGGQEEYVQIAAVHRFTLIKEMALELDIMESTNSGSMPAGRVVDQRSDLVLRPRYRDDFCTQISHSCAEVIPMLQVIIEGKKANGQDGRQVLDQVPFGDGWKLKVALAEYLGQPIQVKVYYKRAGKSIHIMERGLQVEDIGLVTSFPVVSEIVSAAKRGGSGELNPKDSSFKSTIPISWAFNTTCREGAHGAVTFPWMIGVNTRSAPRLSDVVKVFPHASVIMPLSSTAGAGPSCGAAAQSSAKVQLGFGAGVSLVNAFSISWALTTEGQSFVMLGISAPDIVNIVK